MSKKGSEIIVSSLENHNVPFIFGIPGAKIDGVFDTLEDHGPQLILARHEQNAAFMAQAIGRLTGEPGVVIATSGPGASNLATGLVTATAEGDPVLALAGQVKRSDLSKLTGALSCVEESAVRFSFEIVCHGTVAQGCDLHIVYKPAQAWCWDCSQVVEIHQHDAQCPICHGERLRVDTGDSLIVKSIEVE